MRKCIDQIMDQVFQLNLSKREQTDFSISGITRSHKKCEIKKSVCSPLIRNICFIHQRTINTGNPRIRQRYIQLSKMLLSQVIITIGIKNNINMDKKSIRFVNRKCLIRDKIFFHSFQLFNNTLFI
jgi:hypothetical protein